jgi:hypothetical protein
MQHFNILTQQHEPTLNRRDTQWHTLFQQSPSTTVPPHPPAPARFHERLSAPAPQQQQQNRQLHSPSTISTIDPFISLFQAITDSNNHLHNAICKQQETLLKQQQTLREFLTKESQLCRQQTALLQKQLDAIIALAPPQHRVPATHFQPEDGISFASTGSPPLTQLSHTEHKPAPIIQVNSNQQAHDDSSVVSVHSLQQGYQDTKITISTFEESWLQSDATAAKLWLSTIISELASKTYYHTLLTPDKRNINYDAPVKGPNAILHSALQSKLSKNFQNMIYQYSAVYTQCPHQAP